MNEPINADERVPVCTVDGVVVMGTQQEAAAARLNSGDRIRCSDGAEEVVDFVWCYDDGVIVSCRSGRRLIPFLGDQIEVLS